jgi:hypothetical protein
MSQWFQTPPPFPSFSNASKNQWFSKNNQAKNQQLYSRQAISLVLRFLGNSGYNQNLFSD